MQRTVAHAHRILEWQENLQTDEMPPEWMWPHDDELELWFEEVDRARKERYGGGGDDSGSETMLKNEYAEGRG